LSNRRKPSPVESKSVKSSPGAAVVEPPGDRSAIIPTREAILQALKASKQPLTPMQLAERFNVAGSDWLAMNKRIAAMERDGQLMPNRKGVLLLPAKIDLLPGKVMGHRDGFGFLLLDEGGPDLFLSNREMQKVMHGDRVLARRIGFDSRGRPEGQVVEVTERANRRLVGRFLNERGVNIVVPEDQRIKHDILIPPGESLKAQPGQVVTVEITDPPTGHGHQPMGRVAEVLGEIDDPGMEIEIAVRKFDVPHEFSAATIEAAAALPSKVRPADLKGRVDLRDVPLVTIDGDDARDFDDAVYAEATEDGGWRCLVAIADVSHYVTQDDAIDKEAVLRTTSVYFPRRVIPMLPEKLSNGLCSLNPEVDRLVLVCDMIIDAHGNTTAYQFYNAVMHSAARLTYDEVWGILSGRDAAAMKQRLSIVPRLQCLYDLFHVLAKQRKVRGAMEFESRETKIICDAAGRIEQIVGKTRNDAHKLIEECMLAANVCAADFLVRSKHPGLYRVHEGPTPEKLERLRVFLRTVGMVLPGGDDPSPGDYAAFSASIAGRPDVALLQTMLLRSMQQAIYTPENSGHFGLAYEAYTHFTSPIRRYPDLLTHRAIKALVAHKRYDYSKVHFGSQNGDSSTKEQTAYVNWQSIGQQCSFNERRADDASRDVEAWLKCQYMRERVGEEFAGRITGVAAFGVFVTLNDLFVEGLVHVSELGSEYFQLNEAAHELRGERTGRRFRLTEELHVQVSRVDLEARRIEFRLVQKATAKDWFRLEAAKANPHADLMPPEPGSAAPKRSSSKTGRGKKAAPAREVSLVLSAGDLKAAPASRIKVKTVTKRAGAKRSVKPPKPSRRK
jgi:ribonuclease R